jgi:hypothetical protein
MRLPLQTSLQRCYVTVMRLTMCPEMFLVSTLLNKFKDFKAGAIAMVNVE